MRGKKKAAVVGAGYVGLATAAVLSETCHVTLVDTDREKVRQINEGRCPIKDADLEEYFESHWNALRAICDGREVYAESDFVLIAVPTDLDPDRGSFRVSIVEAVISDICEAVRSAGRKTAPVIVIRSTVPVGFTSAMRHEISERYPDMKACFLVSPEFLREGTALRDMRNPSRIVLGTAKVEEVEEAEKKALEFVELLRGGMQDPGNVRVMILCEREAEAAKLFSNTYLAMRAAFFNELDTYAEALGLCSESLNRAVSADPRIGSFYNNPSFGYGGSCLPKDSRELLSEFQREGIPQSLIGAIVKSNMVRKDYVAGRILKMAGDRPVGIYRLTSKKASGNFRQSAVWDIMRMLREAGCAYIVYEPDFPEGGKTSFQLMRDFDRFQKACGVIAANRKGEELKDTELCVYTRDLYEEN